jgi:hypothetical protein
MKPENIPQEVFDIRILNRDYHERSISDLEGVLCHHHLD